MKKKLHLILILLTIVGCCEKPKSKKYSKTFMELEKINTDSSLFQGTPTYDKLKNNKIVNVKWRMLKREDGTKLLGKNSNDTIFYSLTDSISITKIMVGATTGGNVYKITESNHTINIKTIPVIVVDTTQKLDINNLDIIDGYCSCYNETKIIIKIYPKNKMIIFDNKILKL